MQDVRINYVANTSGLKPAETALKNLSDDEKELLAQLKKVNAEATAMGKNLGNASEKGSKGAKSTINDLKGLGSVASGIGGVIGGIFAVDKALEFGKKIIDVTSQFQKLQAVLSNALGGQQAGDIAFEKITAAAAKTNFSVLELTDTYVKFANRGLKLTNDEIFNLADIANSTGKSIDQLTEAALDAFSGENERLKEFGITAKKTGETTQFTFKGVTTEVKNSQEAIKAYILGLGDLEGVSGSTAAISATLEGRISNLGDALDNLFFTIGSSGSSAFGEFLGFLTASIQAVDRLIQGADELRRRQGLRELGEDAEKLPKLLAETAEGYQALGLSVEEAKQKAKDFLIQDASENIAKTKEELLQVKDNIEIINGLEKGLIENQLEILGLSKSEKTERLEIARARGQELENQIKIFQQRINLLKQGDEVKPLQQQIGLIEELQKKIKALRDEQEKSTEEKRVLAINGEVRKLQTELDRLLGKTKDVKKEFDTLTSGLGDKLAKDVNEASKNIFGEDSISFIKQNFEFLKNNLEQETLDLIQRIREVGKREGRSAIEIEAKVVLVQTDYLAQLRSLEIQASEEISSIEEARTQEFISRTEERMKKTVEEYEDAQKLREKQEEDEKEHQAKLRAIREEATRTFQDFTNAAFEFAANKREADLDKAQLQRDEELKRVGDDKQAQAFINEKFNRIERENRRKQAQADKQQALFNIAIDTAIAVGKSIAASPITFGLPFSAFALAQGAIQAALVASKPLPAFKNGVIDLQGPGTSTSDSIVARLSRHETVMTGQETKSYKPTFEAIRAGRINPELLNAVAMGKTPVSMVHNHTDYRQLKEGFAELVNENKMLRKTMAGLPITKITLDKKGFNTSIEERGNITRILNNQWPT